MVTKTETVTETVQKTRRYCDVCGGRMICCHHQCDICGCDLCDSCNKGDECYFYCPTCFEVGQKIIKEIENLDEKYHSDRRALFEKWKNLVKEKHGEKI